MAIVITYVVTNGEFPITVTLATVQDPNTVIATNIHNAYGQYVFSGFPDGDYWLTFTDALGCTINDLACDLTPEIGIVYNCVFDFTVDISQIPASPTPTPTQTPMASRTPTPTQSITLTPSGTPGPTPSITSSPSVTPSVSPTITPTASVSPSLTRTVTPTRTITPTVSPSITSSVTPTPTIAASKTPTPTVTTSKTPTPTVTVTKSPTPTPTPGPPQLGITNLTANCTGNTITVNISGGTAPYQYSVDNGVTLSSPTVNTTYTWNSLTGGIYDVYVIDSLGQVYQWPEINCNIKHVTFIPIYLTANSIWGSYIQVQPGGLLWQSEFTRNGAPGSSFSIDAFRTGSTVFLGWSYELGDRITVEGGNIHLIQPPSPSLLTYTFPDSSVTEIDVPIIYAYFTDYGATSFDFCYVPIADPTFINEPDRISLCTVCTGNTVKVYFDTTLYLANGIENVIWYSNAALTIPVANGYYIDGSEQFSTIYGVSNNGTTITNLGTCGGTEASC